MNNYQFVNILFYVDFIVFLIQTGENVSYDVGWRWLVNLQQILLRSFIL